MWQLVGKRADAKIPPPISSDLHFSVLQKSNYRPEVCPEIEIKIIGHKPFQNLFSDLTNLGYTHNSMQYGDMGGTQ